MFNESNTVKQMTTTDLRPWLSPAVALRLWLSPITASRLPDVIRDHWRDWRANRYPRLAPSAHEGINER